MSRNQELDKFITWMSLPEHRRYHNDPVIVKMMDCLHNLDGNVGFSYKNWLLNAHGSEVLTIQIQPMPDPRCWIPGYRTVNACASTYVEFERADGTSSRRDFAGCRVIANDSNTMLALDTSMNCYLFYTFE